MAGMVFLVFFVVLALGFPIIMCMMAGAIVPLAMSAPGASSIEALIRGAQMRALPFDPGPFSPHITLARRAVLSQEALDSLHPRPLSFRPTQAHVFLSARDAQGSLCYTPLASAPFA